GPWRVHVAALGLVGRGTCAGCATNEMAISLAGAVRLLSRHRRFSLHGFDVAAVDWLALHQIVSPNPQHLLGLADAVWCRARFRIVRARMARDSRSRSRFSTRTAADISTLAVACSACCIARLDTSFVDSEVGRFLVAKCTAYGDRIGLRLRRSRCAYCWFLVARAYPR